MPKQTITFWFNGAVVPTYDKLIIRETTTYSD